MYVLKITKTIIRHTVPILSAVVIFLSCFSFSANAAALNYRDYEKYVTVEGDKDLVTLEFPIDEWTSWYFATSDLSYREQGRGTSFSLEPILQNNLQNFMLMLAPFGGASFSYGPMDIPGHYLSSVNIPSDATWSLKLDIFFDDRASTLHLTKANVRNWYVTGSSCNIVDEKASDSLTAVSEGVWEMSYSGDFVPGYDGWFPQFLLRFSSFPAGISFTLRSFQVTMSISSLYRLQEQSGQTNELLEDVNRQLEEQGKTMNDILNGTPEQNESANNAAGVLGDKGEQLGDLAGAIHADKPNLDSVNTNVGDLVPSNGLNTLTSAISPIANNELVIKVLIMVATLILVSYVLFGKKG